MDCVRFVAGVLEELFGWEADGWQPPRIPHDAAVHQKDGGAEVLRAFKKRYPGGRAPYNKETGHDVEPGANLVCG